jgi:poly-gamma-glutamate capsule biosynthesis protein CapA/YwtB (metallophosphatase superfamily)
VPIDGRFTRPSWLKAVNAHPVHDVTLALCGDIMLGRGIDQILPFPSDPRLYEGHMGSALDYVLLAEVAHGPIPRHVSLDHVWGDMLADLRALRPQARIANLETSITKSDTPVPKGINYRMHPTNVGCLTAAAFDCCVLANNHVLDWGVDGLLETLATLKGAGIRLAGAGRNAAEAAQPATIDIASDRRVLVFGYGARSSGIPRAWGATEDQPGVNLLPDLTSATAARLAEDVKRIRHAGDLVVLSIHWGSNWGYQVTEEQRAFAHALIDAGACDLVHGHSSHHVRPIEVYRERLILYGCGDFINDYEGISGYEQYRGDLSVMYLPRLSHNGAITELTLLPYRIRRFQLSRASRKDATWLQTTLDRESMPFGCRVAQDGDGRLTARWA